MFNKRILLGSLLLILGIALISYAVVGIYPTPEPETWLHQVGRFFHNLWDKITGHQDEELSRFSGKTVGLFVSGALLSLSGCGLLFSKYFRKRR
jgi:hypothetical protein